MKKLLLTLALAAASVAAYAQGKVAFANDSLHLVYFGTALKAADVGLAGAGVNNVATPSGITFMADLYAGTTSGNLVFYSSTTFQAVPGRYNLLNTALNAPPIPGGTTPAFFQVQIRDAAFTTAALAAAGNSYSGLSEIFTVRPSSTIAYNSLVLHGSPGFSTWTDGTFAMGGNFGAIKVEMIPEPSSLALAGLASASLLLFRRRK